jgi:hypothetical protein
MENKKSFNADAMVAGFVIGIGLLAVDLLSALMGWELKGTTLPRNTLIVAVIVVGTIFFTRKRAALAGAAGMTYGQCLGFISMSMLYAGLLSGIGDVILYKMAMPGYYNELVDSSIKASSRMLRSNPLFAGNREQLDQSLEISRAVMNSPALIIMRNIFDVVLLGVLFGLFTATFCKRQGDPFHEPENE